ncbi:MAG: glucan biosynthesis protein [Beijerinckiaceae bacterium]
MLQRRDVLKLTIGGVATGAGALISDGSPRAQAPNPPDAPPFSFGMVVDLARSLAKRPFQAAANDLPSPFANLGYEQYVAIRARPDAVIWAGDNVGFAIEPLHRGFIFSAPVQIYVIEAGTARRLAYERSQFDFGALQVPQTLRDIGFSGFRVLQPRAGGGLADAALFQGASFFRAIARGQTLGASARGLTIRTGDPRGEEFPAFRAVWIEKPTLAANTLVIYALLDSESVTGAYRFTLRPGEATIIDTEATLIPRVALDHFGLGAMSAAYLFGPIDRRRTDDVRPAVCEVNGLQMLSGRDEWIWRPVANRETLQVSSFIDDNPKGFGFLMRDRDFNSYQDDDQKWETRPSLWIEPIGDWGPGSVQLVEIPSESEVNSNMVAYWRPNQPLAQETSIAYRQFWCWAPPARPPDAAVAFSRGGRGAGNNRRRRFIVAFSGDVFADPQRTAGLKPVLSTTPGSITISRIYLSPERKTCRIVFDIDPGNETYSEIRLLLEAGGKTLSETWLYRWTA